MFNCRSHSRSPLIFGPSFGGITIGACNAAETLIYISHITRYALLDACEFSIQFCLQYRFDRTTVHDSCAISCILHARQYYRMLTYNNISIYHVKKSNTPASGH